MLVEAKTFLEILVGGVLLLFGWGAEAAVRRWLERGAGAAPENRAATMTVIHVQERRLGSERRIADRPRSKDRRIPDGRRLDRRRGERRRRIRRQADLRSRSPAH
jgi:hypothetical protein